MTALSAKPVSKRRLAGVGTKAHGRLIKSINVQKIQRARSRRPYASPLTEEQSATRALRLTPCSGAVGLAHRNALRSTARTVCGTRTQHAHARFGPNPLATAQRALDACAQDVPCVGRTIKTRIDSSQLWGVSCSSCSLPDTLRRTLAYPARLHPLPCGSVDMASSWTRLHVAAVIAGLLMAHGASAQETESEDRGFFEEGAGTTVIIIGAFFLLFLIGVGVYVYRYLKQAKREEEAAAAYAFDPNVVPPVDQEGLYKPYAQQYLTPQQQMMLMMQAEAGMMPAMPSGVHQQESSSFHSNGSKPSAASVAAMGAQADGALPSPGAPKSSRATMSGVSLTVPPPQEVETKPTPLPVATIPSTDGDDQPRTARGGTVFSHAPSVEAQQSMRAAASRQQIQRPPSLHPTMSQQSMGSESGMRQVRAGFAAGFTRAFLWLCGGLWLSVGLTCVSCIASVVPIAQPGQPSPHGVSRRTMGSRAESKVTTVASERAVDVLTRSASKDDEIMSISDDEDGDLVAQAIAAVASPANGDAPPKTPEHFHQPPSNSETGPDGRPPPRDSLSLRSLESL